MEKIIFLDIDGVLNSYKYWDSKEFQDYHKLVESSKNYKEVISQTKEIDPEAVEVLNKIIELTKAKIVVSSTWRSRMDEVHEALNGRNFKGEIIDRTPKGCYDCLRGNEILKWMKDNQKIIGDYSTYKNYVILDDDSDMLYWQRNNFIQINTKEGLSEKHIEQCVKILN
jgi:hypothetical protein